MVVWDFLISYEYTVDLGISIGILLLFLLFRKIFTKYVFSMLLKLSKKAPSELLSQVFVAYEKPIQWLFIVIGIYFAVKYFPFLDNANPFFLDIIRSAMIAIISWGLLNLSSSSSLLLLKLNERYDINIDQILIPFFSKVLRFIIVAITFSVILQEFGYEVSGFVAGLGLGGLAVSLAAKDALANLFGGIVIITEKPFTIGDWILTPTVEGTVEDITFRSTKIRTFADALVTVPNATLASESITNWSKMGKRRITFTLRVTYDTPREKLKAVIDRIESLLKKRTDIHQDTILVTFNEYMENGLDLFLYFFTKTTNWEAYLKIKEDINFEIMDILRSEGVEFALPATKLYVDSEDETVSLKSE